MIAETFVPGGDDLAACAALVQELAAKKIDPNTKRNLLRAYSRSHFTDAVCEKLEALVAEQRRAAAALAACCAAAHAVGAWAVAVHPPFEDAIAAVLAAGGSPRLRVFRRLCAALGPEQAAARERQHAAAAAARRAAACRNRVEAARVMAKLRVTDAEGRRMPALRRAMWDSWNALEQRRQDDIRKTAALAARRAAGEQAALLAAAERGWCLSQHTARVLLDGGEAHARRTLGLVDETRRCFIAAQQGGEATRLRLAAQRRAEELRGAAAAAEHQLCSLEQHQRVATAQAEIVARCQIAVAVFARPSAERQRGSPGRVRAARRGSLPTTA
eukprot:TRINITY_DN67235_c0_g1_i1.p2 TRINITY_DN67235_c0_g1~~TRINITY_DN67235_c0_g1_i1.p2  ORF type:complete len:357 (+),score=95.82 TRINITY_DN67235_c0_g1_i1:84-1073(+)